MLAPGAYGPYRQSARHRIYLTYVRELLRRGQAYPCFATKEELAALAARQQAAKVPPGYYGSWAAWRDADPADVAARLAGGAPYVIRFRAPDDAAGQRVRFTDAIRGELEQDANRNDAVILKSAGPSPRLPTYHLAHAVDDHLMRVTLVIRGEEWISSVPLHQQLFAALGFEPVRYAHIALLMKPIPGGKRKLSKRKIRKRASTSTSPPGIPPMRSPTTCGAWPTGASLSSRSVRPWPPPSGWTRWASPARWWIWPSSRTSALITSPP